MVELSLKDKLSFLILNTFSRFLSLTVIESLPTSKVDFAFIMQNDVALGVNSEIGAVFIFFYFEDSLIVIDLVYFEDVEELVPHFNQLFLSSVVGREASDGWDGWD